MTVSDDFRVWRKFREREEGGWAKVAGDRGGLTRYGITIGLLERLHAQGKYLHIQMDTMTPDEADEIAWGEFWLPTCAVLPFPLNVAFADFHFNSGSYAIKRLQRAIGAPETGVLDAATMADVLDACAKCGAREFAIEYNELRTRFIGEIHKAGSIVKGDHSIEEENKFLTGLMVRLVRMGVLLGGS